MNKQHKILISTALIFIFIFSVQAYVGSGFEPIVMDETQESEKERSFRNHDAILDKIELFPNPAHNVLNVGVKNMKQIEIIDMFGRIVMKKDRCNDNERLDISNLREGLYFIRITTTDEKVVVEKFIKK
ncbi:MAG: T9SS type A sorting domain-containing protein [Bacteroidales bacterium]|nr:T9SS type A sorting domain-containing protein [Bacteroidales bacterium]